MPSGTQMFFQVDVISSFDFTSQNNSILYYLELSIVVLHIIFFQLYQEVFGYEKTFFMFEIINIHYNIQYYSNVHVSYQFSSHFSQGETLVM